MFWTIIGKKTDVVSTRKLQLIAEYSPLCNLIENLVKEQKYIFRVVQGTNKQDLIL